MPKTPALLEDLLAPKRGLGAEYKFEPLMLEVKPNRHGIVGVFTRRAVEAGTEIISVPIVNGSMTPFRAYEEARELLQNLGSTRFNISQEFAIASAIYLRCVDEENARSDVMITESDLAASYAGSPMTSYDSLARAKLLNNNNREALEYAAEMEHQIGQLNVDPNLFRAILAYISSRAWKGVGVIPVLDWFNASYGDGANCTFQMREGRFCYVAIKDIAPNDEILWKYNNANAITTWLNYGYVDIERPTLAFLEIEIEEERRVALERFATQELNLAFNKNASGVKVNKCLFQRELLTPGKVANIGEARISVANCMKTFASTRAWFRLLILSGDKETRAPVRHANINSDAAVFGLDVEARVVAAMRTALTTGLERLYERIEEFSKSEVGRTIDMTPFVEMATEANKVWEKALSIAEAVCSTRSLEKSIPAINSALGLSLYSESELKTALDEIEIERPSLIAAIVGSYAKSIELADKARS